MATRLTIRQPVTAAVVAAPPPPAQPKAQIRAHDSETPFTIPYAPRGATFGGWADPVSRLPRPGRKPLTVRDGENLETLSFTFPLARPDHQQDVEDYLAALRQLAKSGDRVTLVNLSPGERGPWRIDTVDVIATLRQAGSNRITRADVTLALVEASDADTKLGPVSGGKGGKGGKRPKFYEVKKGDTLRKIADRFYGDPSFWRLIARANGIKDPENLKVGRKLKLPDPPKGEGNGGGK